MNRLLLSIALVGTASLHAGSAENPPAPTADDLIAARKAGMEVQSSTIAAILQAIGANADITHFEAAGDAIAAWGQALPELFPPGTETGQDTQARPAVWSDRAGFEKAAAKLTAAARTMAKAAAAGNQSEFINAFRATNLACAACHFTYRFGRN
jgi:cytochrome c556